MRFVYNDGGRKDAGFKGSTRDCVTRAIAIITQKPYREVYNALNNLSEEVNKRGHKLIKTEYGYSYKKISWARTGVIKSVYEKYLKSLGYVWVPTMKIGSGCKFHLNEKELPKGRLIVRVSKHLTAVIDGVIYDTFDPSRNGQRCVYGYFYKPNN